MRKNDLKDFGVCVGTTDTETGIELGELSCAASRC